MPVPVLGGVLQGAVTGATGTYKDRLVDQLTAQREKDLQWRQAQSHLFEEMVRAGHFPGIGQDEIDQRLQEIWGDHKGNKKTLQDTSERATGVRNVLQHLESMFGAPQRPVNQPMTRTPFGQVTTPGAPTQTTTTAAVPAGQVGVSFGPSAPTTPPSRFAWPPAPPRTPTYDALGTPPSGGPKVGDVGTHQGKRVRVNSINPDGTLDIEDLQ